MTWLQKAEQLEVWSNQREMRVFDPAVFDNNPIFDTGSSAGVWSLNIKQPEIWAEV